MTLHTTIQLKDNQVAIVADADYELFLPDIDYLTSRQSWLLLASVAYDYEDQLVQNAIDFIMTRLNDAPLKEED